MLEGSYGIEHKFWSGTAEGYIKTQETRIEERREKQREISNFGECWGRSVDSYLQASQQRLLPEL